MTRNKRTFDTPKSMIHLVERCANPSCGCTFWPNDKAGRKGKYCSDKCKQEAYRTRKALEQGKKMIQELREDLNRNKVVGRNYEQLVFEELCPKCWLPMEQDIDNDWVCPDCLYVKRGEKV